ncbi:hypothetical protein Tco_0439397 [Tanacetum coccineum]
MLATRGSGKVTTMETRANKTKSIRCLEDTLLSQATRKSMMETYHRVKSASITTLARVQKYEALEEEMSTIEVSKLCGQALERISS